MGRWRDLDTSPLRDSGVVASSGVDTSTAPTPPALTGTLGDDLVINVYVSGTSHTGLSQTTTNLTNNGWTVRANINNSSTADDRVAVTLGEKVGATDRPTITSSVVCDWATLSLSLRNLPFTPALLQPRRHGTAPRAVATPSPRATRTHRSMRRDSPSTRFWYSSSSISPRA